MKKILYVLLEQWADWEPAYLRSAVTMLGNGAFENKTVSITKSPVTSIGGAVCVPDYDLQDVPDDYVALILVGGLSWHSEQALQVAPLVQECVKSGKVLGAICDACRFIGTLGILNKGKHTANDLLELQQSAGAAYTNAQGFLPRQAVADCNIVTANGTAALEFAQEVLRTLHVADDATIRTWYDFHKLGLYTAPLPNMG